MNFRRAVRREEPEINFIPLIDLLLVILIFLMVTTTYNRFTELQVKLPSANADAMPERPAEIIVSVTPDGQYTVDRQPAAGDAMALSEALRRSATADRQNPTVIINADAGASHQSVINVLEAARIAGLAKVSFAAQSHGSR